MSILFISHRSTDKAIADLFADFLLLCGIKTDFIFCSSLPGNDIKVDIPAEIKDNLHKSVLNIVLLSADYYKSPYCVNEEGIIWYLDTPKLIIGLPEINDKVMEGFLNNDNKIRRLDNEQDLLAIADILRPRFPDFVNSAAKLNINIDKLIKGYKAAIEHRTVSVPKENPPKMNSIEDCILADNFLNEELVVLRYMYDSKTDVFNQDNPLFLGWLKDHRIEVTSSIDIAEYLSDSGIAKKIISEWERFYTVQLTTNAYRNLMKLSKKALDFIDMAIENSTKKINQPLEIPVSNRMDQLVVNGLTDNELLFIKYILDSERVKFMCGWQLEQELQKIQAWEEINSINGSLSKHYSATLDKLLLRKIIRISQETSSGNPKEYELTNDSFKQIYDLSQASKRKIEAIVEKNKIKDLDDELPF